MSSIHQSPDSRGHNPGCPHFGEQPSAEEDCGYADLYCDCHNWKEPRILAGGTNVAWPAAWSEAQALAWRAKNGLAAPAPIYCLIRVPIAAVDTIPLVNSLLNEEPSDVVCIGRARGGGINKNCNFFVCCLGIDGFQCLGSESINSLATWKARGAASGTTHG